MKTKNIIIGILGILWWVFLLGDSSFAQDWGVQPEITGGQITEGSGYIHLIWQTGGQVMDKYREIAGSGDVKWEVKLATGIMDRSTLLDYVVYLVKLLSQLWLFAGALMIIYAGYQYATQILGGETNKGNTAIKYAIIWILVISFSYAIIKFLTAMFLGT